MIQSLRCSASKKVNNIIIALFILGLQTSNNLQFKYKNDIKQYFTEILKTKRK